MSETDSSGETNDIHPVEAILATAGLNNDQIAAIRAEGFDDLSDFLTVTDKEINDMAGRITGLAAARGGTRIGVVHIKKLQAVAFWIFFILLTALVTVPMVFTILSI